MSLLLALQGAPPVETVTVDKWFVPFSEPKPRPRAGQPPFGALPEFVAAPTVAFDWFVPFSTPARVPARLQRQFAAMPELPTVPFAWFGPLADPSRVRLGPSQQPFGAAPEFVPAAPVTLALDWFVPFSDPALKQMPGLTSAQQQFAALPELVREYQQVPFEWFGPLSDPMVKVSLRLPAAALPFGAQPELVPEYQVVPFDWFDPLSVPTVKVRLGLAAALHPRAALPEDPIADPTPPQPPASAQFTVSGEQVIDRFTHDGVTYTFAAITRRTN